MNFNITIDVTPGTARRLAYLGTTLLVLGGTAAAYAVPVTFVSQQKLTAAQLNENFGHLDSRLTEVRDALASKADAQLVPVVTEWQMYSPSLTTSSGIGIANQTTNGYYRRVGDTLEARVYTLFTGAPNSGASWWQWGLPANLAIDSSKVGPNALATVGSGGAYQNPRQSVALGAYVRTSKSVSVSGIGGESPYINDTVPVTFDNGASISFEFSVPIQGWTATQ